MKKIIVLISIFQFASVTQASSGKEFVRSVIYGTLAGTIVGAATLAFTSTPGDNLNNVARGASYGMYAGILLGLYVSSGSGDSDPNREQGPGQQPVDPSQQPPGSQGSPEGRAHPELKKNKLDSTPYDQRVSHFAVYPIYNQISHDVGFGTTLVDIRF